MGGGPVRHEVDVSRTDGGTLVLSGEAAPGGPAADGAPGADGGTPAALVPPSLLAASPADYPEALKGSGVAGTVQLELLVSEAGEVEEVVLAQGAHPQLDAAAAQAARGLRFTPARQGGRPLAVRLRYAYEFLAPAPAPQEGTLAGEVRTRGNRKAVPNAALLLQDAGAPGGERLLAEADAQGRFTAALPPGAHTLTVRAAGHRPATFTETLAAGGAVQVLYRLEPLVVDPYETVVRDERPRSELARHTLQEQELRQVPGTLGDPFRVVMLLPGVSSVASGLSYPVVRGSQPAATGYLIDGVRVPGLFHLGLGPAVVHPDFIDRMDFFPGSPPARYGRNLSGVVEGQASRPRDDRLHASAYADLINAGAFAESQLPGALSDTHVTLSGRYSYTGGLLALMAGVAAPPNSGRPVADFWDYQGRVEQKLGNGGRLRLLALGSSDLFGNDMPREQDLDPFATQAFHRLDLRYRQPVFGDAEAEVAATWGTEQVGLWGRQGERVVGEYMLRASDVALRGALEAPLSPVLGLTVGGDVNRRAARAVFTLGAPEGDAEGDGDGTSAFRVPDSLGVFAGLYGELAWRPDAAWTVTAGLRGDSYRLANGDAQHFSVDPRLSVRHQLTPALALKAGGAVTHQAPTVLLQLPVMDIAGLRYGLQEMWQANAGAEWAVLPGLELAVDGYYSHLPRTLEFDLMAVLQEQRRRGLLGQDLAGTGRAYGLEVMLRHPLGGGWFGWVSYSLQRSEREVRFIDLERYDATREVLWKDANLPFAFDQTHVLNAALSWQLAHGWTLGGVVHFNTGRPESGLISSRTSREVHTPQGTPAGWTPVSRDLVERLPSFWRVDARVSKTWTYDEHTLELYLDVLNASVQSETLGYSYGFEPFTSAGDELRLSRTPVAIPVVAPMLGLKGTY
jgi:TonB family protein